MDDEVAGSGVVEKNEDDIPEAEIVDQEEEDQDSPGDLTDENGDQNAQGDSVDDQESVKPLNGNEDEKIKNENLDFDLGIDLRVPSE